MNLHNAKYPIVGTEHDKVITDVPEDYGTIEEIKSLMLMQPPHADGLPLATDGKFTRRYGK